MRDKEQCTLKLKDKVIFYFLYNKIRMIFVGCWYDIV